MDTSMIKAEHLTFGYGKNKQVFNDFNLEIEKGKIVGLLGKNGTGKSTLLYIICGLLKPSHGNVTIKGIDIRRRLPQTLSDIYLVPEEFDLPNLSIKQFVKLNSGFYPNFSRRTLHGTEEESVYVLRSCHKHFSPAHGRTYKRTGHSVEKPVQKGYSVGNDRRKDYHNLYPSGKGYRQVAGSHNNNRRY